MLTQVSKPRKQTSAQTRDIFLSASLIVTFRPCRTFWDTRCQEQRRQSLSSHSRSCARSSNLNSFLSRLATSLNVLSRQDLQFHRLCRPSRRQDGLQGAPIVVTAHRQRVREGMTTNLPLHCRLPVPGISIAGDRELEGHRIHFPTITYEGSTIRTWSFNILRC